MGSFSKYLVYRSYRSTSMSKLENNTHYHYQVPHSVTGQGRLLILVSGCGYYRVSQNIGSTLFFVIFLSSGAHTEELLTFFQQPWKLAPVI